MNGPASRGGATMQTSPYQPIRIPTLDFPSEHSLDRVHRRSAHSADGANIFYIRTILCPSDSGYEYYGPR